MHEIELKFQILPAQVPAVLAWLDQRPGAQAEPHPQRLLASYVDTPDRALAAARLALRVRHEGGRWVQTLKGEGSDAVTRLEHNVPLRARGLRPPPVRADLHRGTEVGERLAQVLEPTARDAPAGAAHGLRVLYRTDIERRTWQVHTSYGTVEVALDQGWLIAGDRRQAVCELEIERVDGEAGLFALALELLEQVSAWIDLRSKAERGLRLADGTEAPPRRARAPQLPRSVDAVGALRLILGETVAHALSNAQEIAAGQGQAEHLHQLRVALRRSRSALRLFRGMLPFDTRGWNEAAAQLFRELGAARDVDALAAGIEPALRDAGAPCWALPRTEHAHIDVCALLRSPATQRLWLHWIALAHGLTPPSAPPPDAETASGATPGAGPLLQPDAPVDAVLPAAQPAVHPKLARAREPVTRRLQGWWRQARRDARRFEQLSEPQVHELRKRIKRLRYCGDFAGSWYRRADVARHARRMARMQDVLGELTDVMIALPLYEAWARSEPGAAFAVGWLQARRAHLRERAAAVLGREMERRPFWR